MEAIGQLTAGVAHESNSILTVIFISVADLRRKSLASEKRSRCIDAIASTADRAIKLNGQLLAFARWPGLPNLLTTGYSNVLDSNHDPVTTTLAAISTFCESPIPQTP